MGKTFVPFAFVVTAVRPGTLPDSLSHRSPFVVFQTRCAAIGVGTHCDIAVVQAAAMDECNAMPVLCLETSR
eukprot:CAMPEP_0179480640 /NCGR_PEP_ID=MMETSP0799-20121207/58562_1 /TAXON_ID=46947 /ORGANISM="Geminigera cryophila, Strain CCMP2564" /LENGTH=71 /DNA_ID=CAMNT_0021292837 /DNA_START=24 /DNA_END=236 /DNA_ORIENTATION=-